MCEQEVWHTRQKFHDLLDPQKINSVSKGGLTWNDFYDAICMALIRF